MDTQLTLGKLSCEDMGKLLQDCYREQRAPTKEELCIPTPKKTRVTYTSERTLFDIWGTEAIAERNTLQKRVEELEAENKYLRGVDDHGFGPEHGKVCIARYVFEQEFKIPKRAVSHYVKWGTLHWMGEDRVWHEAYAFDGDELDEIDFKRPDSVRYTDEGYPEDYDSDEEADEESDE